MLYNGINKYPLHVKSDQPVTLTYDVSVTRGSLILKVTETNNSLFEKEFKANVDEEDSFTFTPTSSYVTVNIIGAYTAGSCDVDVV